MCIPTITIAIQPNTQPCKKQTVFNHVAHLEGERKTLLTRQRAVDGVAGL